MQLQLKIIATFIASICMLIAASGAAVSQSKEVIKWKKVGPWEIRVDRTLNYGCFLQAAYQGGTDLRFGFSHLASQAFILIADPDWASLEDGKDYPLEIQFDKKPLWSGDASGFRFSGVVALLMAIPTKQVDFFSEFARSHTIYISYKGKTVANLNLKGSYAAIQELLRCQKNMQAIKSADTERTSDPFATRQTSTRQKDPFAQ